MNILFAFEKITLFWQGIESKNLKTIWNRLWATEICFLIYNEEQYQFKHLSLIEFLTALKNVALLYIYQAIKFISGILGTTLGSKDILNYVLNIFRSNKENPDIVHFLTKELKRSENDLKSTLSNRNL